MAIIKADKEKISDKVVILGNLDRQKTINSYLKNAEKISEFAGYHAYTGEYKGEKITTIFHGIGIPSMALIVDDLISMGARKIVRFGSSNAVSEKVKPGTAVLPIGYSYYPGGVFRQYLKDDYSIALTPDYTMLKGGEEKLKNAGIKTMIGNVFTSDALMTHNKEFAEKLGRDGHLALELEGAGLYFIAKLKGASALSVHLAYGNLITGESLNAEEITEKEKIISESILDLLVQ
jgi:DeoD family purine-nucleoside phosphorylase